MQSTIFLAIMYIVLIVQFLVAILLIISLVKSSQKDRKSSTFSAYCVKLLSFYGIILNTIGLIPFFNIFISTIYCTSSNETGLNLSCYSGIYFLHFILAIFGMILLLLFTLLFLRLYIDLNPNSSLPFASPQSQTNLVRTVLKIVLPLYTAFDVTGNIAKPFIVCMGLY